MVTVTAPGSAAQRASVDAPPRSAIGIVADAISCRRVRAELESASFEVIASASSVRSLLDRAVAPMDLAVLVGGGDALGRGGAVELARNLRPRLPIVFVATSAERALVRKALRMGADGVVAPLENLRALTSTIVAALAGQIAVPQTIRKRVAWGTLSLRERQVLELVASGLTNGEIADRLYLSESTVKSHLSSSFRKLSVCSRAEAAAAVLDPEHGLSAYMTRLARPDEQLEHYLLAIAPA